RGRRARDPPAVGRRAVQSDGAGARVRGAPGYNQRHRVAEDVEARLVPALARVVASVHTPRYHNLPAHGSATPNRPPAGPCPAPVWPFPGPGPAQSSGIIANALQVALPAGPADHACISNCTSPSFTMASRAGCPSTTMRAANTSPAVSLVQTAPTPRPPLSSA